MVGKLYGKAVKNKTICGLTQSTFLQCGNGLELEAGRLYFSGKS
jgi:hypothetical protein